MDKRIFGILALVLLLGAGFASTSAPTTGSDLLFTASRIDPAAAMPGGSLDFNVVVQNWGLATASNVTVTIILPDDMLLKDSSTETQSLGPLCSLCNAEIKYPMKVGEKAISGDYIIKVVASWTGGSREKEFTVSVSGTPKLAVTDVTYRPEEIEPGKTVAVTMTVRNIGSAPALNGAAGISLPTLTGDTKSRFSVIGSGTEVPLGTLGVGETATVSFRLAVDDNVEAGVYNFPLNLSYSGQMSYSGVGIVVISKALLTLPKVQTDPVTVTPDKTFLLSATVENTGKNDAKSVTVRLVGENSRLSGTKSAYLGTVKSGDKDVALFEVTYAGPVLARTDVPVAFEVSYSDDFGEHSFTESGEITVERGVAAGSGPSLLVIGGVVIAAAAGAWFLFLRKRPSQKR